MSAIAIFVKTPGHSPIKTRLAAGIGQEAAETTHMLGARVVADVALAADIGPVYWAVAEGEALDEPHWSSLPVIEQGAGGLGRRMAHVHAALVERHGSAILLGADTPQIRTRDLERARDWLHHDTNRLVIGPADDGGFWLFGANRLIDPQRWQSVTYSRPDTLDHFRRNLGDCGQWLELPRLADLDTPDDLPAVIAALARLPQPLPGQTRLREQLEILSA